VTAEPQKMIVNHLKYFCFSSSYTETETWCSTWEGSGEWGHGG